MYILDLCPKGYMLGAFKLACMRFSYDELGWNDAAMACRATNDSLLVLDTIKDIVGFRTLRAQFYGECIEGTRTSYKLLNSKAYNKQLLSNLTNINYYTHTSFFLGFCFIRNNSDLFV